MKATLLTLCAALSGASLALAQNPLALLDFPTNADGDQIFVFVGQNEGGNPTFYDLSYGEDDVTITGKGANAAFATFVVDLPQTVDLSEQPQIFVRASGTGSPSIRIDVVDADGRQTNNDPATFTPTTEPDVYTLNYGSRFANGNNYNDNCAPGSTPCDVDATRIVKLFMNIDAGTANDPASKSVTFDYIALGEDITGSTGGGGGGGGGGNEGPAIFVDALGSSSGFVDLAQNWSFDDNAAGGEVGIKGNGNTGAYENFTYAFLDAEGEPASLDFESANNRLFVRAKASTPVSLRIDVGDANGRDVNNFNYYGGNTASLTTEFQVFEIDYTGEYNDGCYYSTGCGGGPPGVAVDGSDIQRISFYVAPDVGGYSGTVTFDYISVGAEPSNVLPVSLASFDAETVDAGVNLEWVTASEQDNSFFAVEMSRDGNTFAEVGTVEGAGTTTAATAYDYTHYTTEAGTYYFRLAQYDFDGEITRSQVVTAQVGGLKRGATFEIVGNYTDADVTIRNAEDVDVTILDLRGAVLARQQLRAGQTAIDVSHLPSGHYVITDGQHAVRFVK